MFKLLCICLPLLARVAVAVPATLSERCDDPNPSPFAEPAAATSSGPLPFDTETGDVEHIHLEPFDAVPVGPEPVDSWVSIEDGHGSEVVGPSRKKNVVYFADWSIYDAAFLPQQLPAEDITHLLYAFAGIADDGSVISMDPWADEEKMLSVPGRNDSQGPGDVHGAVEQVFLLKKRHRHMKTLLSIGGWNMSQSGKFGPVLNTSEGRTRFAKTAVNLLANWGLDGIDIDYEYPINEHDARTFVDLLRECRKALDEYASLHSQRYHYLLTAAVSAAQQHYKWLDMPAIDRYLDAWHLMAYDYAGSWDDETGDQSNVFHDEANPSRTKSNSDQAVNDYVAAGVNPEKIILGIPLYGRSFLNTDGPGKPYKGVGRGSIEKGVWLYRDLPRPGAVVDVNRKTIAAYSYDNATRELVTYDNMETTTLKAEYLVDKGLGGAVFWEASGDRQGDESLVRAVARKMRHLDNSMNMLSYPQSHYSNIRNATRW
ncbi:glycoside hydrolase family 18 protein [Trichoderma citrinoviride]|uniref:chitinase n=1 Tax=Trichoderma citrinoviride TaxID=58853 RepID=A0A2T4BCW5_9HYPO|nr:glycoside hydrolase family 18 protein [Trichoderma citrinoviride]PTB67173.1 glycoside hydrolase family 18 protein [Trichoderma citrinoviride]